ncbi:MAG TPA: tetratricopeptide repeat protein [Pirellulales bacterium]|nr:tetratricopeptide repeat protein [Pirellulales bacterium]
MRRSSSGVTALMAVLALAQLARGAGDQTWVGRRVMIKRVDVRPRIGQQPTGDPSRAVFTVEKVQGEWLWVGEGWLRSGDVVPVKDALAWFNQELQKRPTAFAYLGRGVARGEQGDLDGAIADCTAALRIEPRSQKAYTDRAIAYGKKREMTLALNDLEVAMAMGPPSAKVFGIRGAVRASMHDYRGALDDLNRALRMNPRDAAAYSNRTAVHTKLGNLAEALADIDKAISLDPRNPVLYANRGWTYTLEHRYQEAIKDFDEAIRLDPKFVLARVNRGGYWLQQGQLEKAIAEYNEAIRLDPKCDAAWRFRSAAHRRSGNLALAASDVDEAIRLAPKVSENYCGRARLDHARGDYQAMLKDATKATELDPLSEDAFQCLASARSLLDDIPGSIADLSRAIELMPNNGRRYLERALMFVAVADYRKALADSDAAVRLLPRETKPLLYRAVTQAALGNFEPAKQDVAAALRLDPENTFDTYGILAQVSAHEAGDAQAVVALEQSLPGATRLQQAAIYSQLALILATYPDPKIRDGQQALAAGKKACELSDGRSFWALVGLAAAHAECGDFAAAVDCQQKALALATSTDPSVAMSSDFLNNGGMQEALRRLALYQSGQPARAKQAFGSKIGSRVIARSPEMRLQIGKRSVGEALGQTRLVVERVRGDWLWVGRGWIRTDDVVPFEDVLVDYINRSNRTTKRGESGRQTH